MTHMRRGIAKSSLTLLTGLLAAASAALPAQVLITEVIPTVSTTSTAGDTVELYNAGGAPVSLTNWILTDADPGSVEGPGNFANEGSFAPPGLALPDLQPGEFAVVVVTLNTGTATFLPTNYGYLITAPLQASGGAWDGDFEQLMLLNAAEVLQDSVVWGVTDAAVSSDARDDLGELTLPTSAWFALNATNAWAGADVIMDQAAYNAADIDATGATAVSGFGAASIQRLSTGTTWSQGAPDSAANFTVTPRHRATLGNFTSDVATLAGLRPIRQTGNLTDRLIALKSSSSPDRRIDTTEDTNRYVEPGPAEMATFRAAIAQMDAGQYEAAFATAQPLGFEVVEYRDTQTGATIHLLIEREVPGQPGYAGGGIYVFDNNPEARQNLILEAPHPIQDGKTLDEAALAIPQLRPRLAMIAGTNRRNHTTLTPCTNAVVDDYRISDVAHVTTAYFHGAHLELYNAVPDTLTVQLHGFCKSCHGSAFHVIASNGVGQYRSTLTPTWLLATNINAMAHMLPNPAGVSNAAVYDYDVEFLGATNTAQGRINNGVALGNECSDDAVAAFETFLHIEQSEAVRDDPQHVIDALNHILDQRDGIVPMPTTATFFSIGGEDGRILEEAQVAGAGGVIDTTGTLRVGDDSANRAYRSVLSFDTSALPNDSVVTSAQLAMTRTGLTGDLPWDSLGDLTVDIAVGFLGASTNIEPSDWQASVAEIGVANVPPLAADLDRASAPLSASGRSAINRDGRTQLKLRFTTQDNNDGGSDYVSLASGENSTGVYRPELQLSFALPTPTPTPSPTPSIQNGDANGDGTRDLADVTEIYNLAAGLIAGPPMGDADVDNDSDVDFADGDALVEFLVNGAPIP